LSQKVILTGVGRDRIGIVAELTETLFKLGCNLLDSSMTLLRGEFAVILMVSLPDNVSPELVSERIKAVQENLGFTLHVRVLSEAELKPPENNGAAYVVSLCGADQPGVVSGITRKLAQLGANITDLQTKHTLEEPFNYVMTFKVTVPADLPVDQLTKELKIVAAPVAVDLFIRKFEFVDS
jgi:glycine cleavage system transcriptional repressor